MKEVVDTCEGATLVRLVPGTVTVDCADPEGPELDCVCEEPVMVSDFVCVVPGTLAVLVVNVPVVDTDDARLEVEWVFAVCEPVVEGLAVLCDSVVDEFVD